MNWLDIAIVIIIALMTLIGFRRGFLRKVLGLAGIIVGVILAVKLYPVPSSLVISLFKVSTRTSYIISFLLIVLLIYAVSVWLSKYVSDIKGISLINRILGAVLGFVQGLIITSLFVNNLSLINYPREEVRNNSIMSKMVSPVAPALFDKIVGYSPELKETYEDYKKSPSNNSKENGKDTNNRRR